MLSNFSCLGNDYWEITFQIVIAEHPTRDQNVKRQKYLKVCMKLLQELTHSKLIKLKAQEAIICFYFKSN